MSTDVAKKEFGKRAKWSKLDVDLIRKIYPVTKAIDYGGGNYEFIRTAIKKSGAIRPERGNIMSLSKKSLIRLMFTMQCTEVEFGTMLTLTYPNYWPKDGEIVKSDVNVVAQRVRRLGWSYVWFLEFQERGAPHLHFLLTPKVITPRMRAWFGLFWTERVANSEWFIKTCPEKDYVVHVLRMARFNCHEDTLQVLRLEDGAKRYATAYAAKEKQKKVPKRYRNVGRFWGASRDVKPAGLEFHVTEDDIEQWLVDNGHPASAYDLVPRYVWAVGKLKRKDNKCGSKVDSGPVVMVR